MMVVGAERRLALRPAYASPSPPPVSPFELPYPKDGLAVAGNAVVHTIPTVSRAVPATKQMTERLQRDIDEAEERTVQALRYSARWTHPLDRDARAKIVPTLEAWYSTALGDGKATVSYVEAVKKYPPQPTDQGCGLETFASGWVFRGEPDGKLKTDLKALVAYCDRENASYMLPLGQLQLKNRLYWVVQMSGQDHEWYSVVELAADRVRYRVEYRAGGVARIPNP
jgi:hypothetical protein